MTFELDLLQRRAIHWNYAFALSLQERGLSEAATGWLLATLPMLEVTALVAVVGAVVARIDRRWCDGPGTGAAWWVLTALHGMAALGALRFLYWVYLHPGRDLAGLPFRWDYLAMVMLAGLPLARAPLGVRTWLLALLSVAFIDQYVGRLHLQVIGGTCLVGWAAMRWSVTNRPGVRVVVQGLLMGGLFAWLYWLRTPEPWIALTGWGLYSFAAFRHVSFVVESGRGVPSSLAGYVCYLLFFPNCVGAMEVYDEFHARNLSSPPTGGQLWRAAVLVLRGNLLVWISLLIPMDEERMRASVGFVAMWSNLLLVFLRAAIGIIGTWDVIEGGALFLGIRLRPNFRYVLAATTPSEFWRAWRATMTNWFIRYVYIPLGGNRRHQTFNIFAIFVVSTVWHCVGIPFLRPQTWTPYEMLPIVVWGLLNFVGVATHARVRRLRPPAERTPPLVVGKWALAMVFGSLTVLLLGFAVGPIERFPHVVRTLLGLEGW